MEKPAGTVGLARLVAKGDAADQPGLGQVSSLASARARSRARSRSRCHGPRKSRPRDATARARRGRSGCD